MSNTADLLVYNFQTGKTSPMPLYDLPPLMKNSLKSKFLRWLFLNEKVSKFCGFVFGNNKLSKFLDEKKLLDKLTPQVTKTYRAYSCTNLNEAFHHRYVRKMYPKKGEICLELANKIFSSPVDAYLNIRPIIEGKVQLYPELTLDLKKMLGPKLAKIFKEGGKLLLFTLKPFHDHTVDYPFNSQVLEDSLNFKAEKKKALPTDLRFAQFISGKSGKTIFDSNHRMVTRLKALDYNEEYVLVEVGAFNVNSIEQDHCLKGHIYQRGLQKSHFNFGSTVIMLLPTKFTKKLYIPDEFTPSENVSVEIQRRNVLAVPFQCPTDFKCPPGIKFSVADGVSMKITERCRKVVRPKFQTIYLRTN